MTDTNEKGVNNESSSQYRELTFFSNKKQDHVNDEPWYQNNPDVTFPLFLIGIGLFQFILRKWILPVSDDVISKLEDNFPSQGLIYMPEFGLFFIIIGIIMLILFHI